MVPLSRAGTISGGLTKNRKRNSHELQVSYLRVANVYQNELRLDDVQQIGLTENEFNKTRLQKGDLLIVEGNGSKGQIGRLAIWDGSVDPCVHQNHLIRVRLSDGVLPKFVSYWFSSPEGRASVEAVASSTSGLYTLSISKVGRLEIPLPPLPEQRRIVARIEELFSRLAAGVAALRHAKAQLQRYRQSILAAAVTGQLTQAWREQNPDTEPSSELLERMLDQREERWTGKGKYREPAKPELKDATEIPASWEWSTAEALSDQNRAITYGVIKLGKDFDEGIPTLRSSDVRPLRIELDHVKQIDPAIAQNYRRTFLEGGELLVTVRGTLGGICVVPDDCTGFNISREVAMIAPVIPEVGPCTALMIASQPLQSWMLGRAKGITYRGVNIETLKRLPIPLPPLAEQHQIVAEVEARTTAIDHLEAELDRQITRSNRLRQSALAAAFCGKL
jgi:type I restriction enzyme S subunit